MDGAKRKSISASELYAAIDTAKAPLVVDAQRAAGPGCRPSDDHRRSSLPSHYIAASHRVGAGGSRSSETSPRGSKR
jgi:hypothetical protein